MVRVVVLAVTSIVMVMQCQNDNTTGYYRILCTGVGVGGKGILMVIELVKATIKVGIILQVSVITRVTLQQDQG
jgi:hypothetical protein